MLVIMFKSSQEVKALLVLNMRSLITVIAELIILTGSGLWMPEAQPLALLRQKIDRKPKQLRQVLAEPQMRNQILGVSSKDEKKAIKAFADQNKENALKTKPKVRVFSLAVGSRRTFRMCDRAVVQRLPKCFGEVNSVLASVAYLSRPLRNLLHLQET